MPFDIRCSSCGSTAELKTDTLVVPEGWMHVILQKLGPTQTADYKCRYHLCPQCAEGIEERVTKKAATQ